MTREQVLERLKSTRAEFDALVGSIPDSALDRPIPGSSHSPKQIVAHVSAYERLIVERLRAARFGEATDLERDRVGWEAFNGRVWTESADTPADAVLARSARDFLALVEEVGMLGDRDLASVSGLAAQIDPAWLQGRTLGEVIGVDGFEHYPMHFAQLQLAAQQA